MADVESQGPTNPEAAFEYLKTVETPSLKEYKMIAQIEAAGLALYKGMAAGTDNDAVKKILLRNGQEEMGHAQRVKRAIKAVWNEDFEIPEDEANPYKVDMAGLVVTKKFLEDFAELEFTGENFYENWAVKSDNEDAARWLRQNGKEETRHGERLREAAALLA